MGFEIEHKYLVVGDSYRRLAERAVEMRQGYLCREPRRTVRIRVSGEKGWITVKGITTGDTRTEHEYEIPKSDALELLQMCEGTIVEKTRYYVPYEGHLWEVDEFGGVRSGLVTAEIELEESGEEYAVPEFVGRNVTGDPEYYNSNL